MTNEQIKSFRSIESLLLSSFEISINDSYYYGYLASKERCYEALEHCVCPVYVKRIYNDFVFPVYLYLDYVNNYIDLNVFSDGYTLRKEVAKEIIDKGENILNEIILKEKI